MGPREFLSHILPSQWITLNLFGGLVSHGLPTLIQLYMWGNICGYVLHSPGKPLGSQKFQPLQVEFWFYFIPFVLPSMPLLYYIGLTMFADLKALPEQPLWLIWGSMSILEGLPLTSKFCRFGGWGPSCSGGGWSMLEALRMVSMEREFPEGFYPRMFVRRH